jgi:DNA mismatch repair ATPase MutS
MKMFFHVDLIKFDQMLDAYRGKEAAVLRMFELLGTLDTVCALASYREYLPVYTRGDFHFPKEGEKPVIRAEELVHPLLAAPVPNSFTVQGGNLITGSNASGKSTFLKSAAIAAIMGQTVCTVPAGAFSSPFIRVLTSMALTDNLSGGESYFIVEIRSLRRIMEASEDTSSGIPVLGVVDEVLRGTNTIERIAASAEILAELAKKPAVTLAATHDIELANILKGSYRNLHFEEEIRDGDVVFSYKLLEGPATTRNAIRLLGLAGYDEEVVERARARAERFETTGNWT